MKLIEWEKAGLDEDDVVVVDEVSVTYTQKPDCTEDSDGEWQELKVSSRNNGVSRFVNIATQNWSVNDAEDIRKVLEDFCHRAGIEKEKED